MHRAQPLQPFTLELTDGQKVDVPHPEFLSFSRGGQTVAVAGENGAFKIIDIYLITAIQLGNCKPTRRRRR